MSKLPETRGICLPDGLPRWISEPPPLEAGCMFLSFAKGEFGGVRYAVVRNGWGIVCVYVDVGWHPAARIAWAKQGAGVWLDLEIGDPHGGWTYFRPGLPDGSEKDRLYAGYDYGHYGDFVSSTFHWSAVSEEEAFAGAGRCIRALKGEERRDRDD